MKDAKNTDIDTAIYVMYMHAEINESNSLCVSLM